MLMLVIIVFSAANHHLVVLHLPLNYGQIEMPAFLLLLLMFVLGVVLASVIGFYSWVKPRIMSRQYAQQIDALQNELDGIQFKQNLIKKAK